jgi:hypothetical protein
MTALINANTTTGVVVTSDTSGSLALQTAGTTALSISSAQVVSLTSGLAVTGTVSATGTITQTGSSGTLAFNQNQSISGAIVNTKTATSANSLGAYDQFATKDNTGTTNTWAMGVNVNTANSSWELYNGGTRFLVTQAGTVLVGLTSSADIVGTTTNGWMIKNNQIQHTSSGTVMYLTTSTSGSQTYVSFYSQTSAVGSITTNGSTTAYVTTSDYRLKEDVQPMTGALAKVAQLKPVTYKWKASGSDGEGFIAHELAEVVPDCVHGSKDGTREEEYEVTPAVKDEEGNITTPAVMGTRTVPVYQGIDTSFLVATLTAAIQELSTQVTELKAEVQALKGA